MYNRILLTLVGILYSLSSFGQDFQFLPVEKTDKMCSYTITAHTYKPSTTYSDSLPAVTSNEYSTLSSGTYLVKSVQDYVFVGVNHDTNAYISAAYSYNISLRIWCVNPASPGSPTSKDITLNVSYNPDSGKSYVDANVFKFSGVHKMYVVVTDIRNAATNAVIARSALPANFYISATIAVEKNDTAAFKIFPSSSTINSGKTLRVSWVTAPSGSVCSTPSDVTVTPAEYELEWQYLDNYGYDPYSGGIAGTGSAKFTSATSGIAYSFKRNSTRVRLSAKAFDIPLVYERGAIIFRLRAVRPDYSDNYKTLIYGGWNIPDVGTVNGGEACKIAFITPHKDSLNWQYTINFAEQAKYKHVINYFDGSLRNRQTQTKINDDSAYIVVADKIYDYEGRAAIQTLPTPVIQTTLEYKDGMISNIVGGKAYKAADFDHASCSTPDSLTPMATTALSRVYYSPLNPDTTTGLQKFVPDAKGYPFIQSIYTPDNLLSWQGGAGYDMQLWLGHGTHYEYMRATQPELDNLFWTEAGKSQFYPKQIITDPNGQSSFIIQNHKGQTVATGLIGMPDTFKTPIDILPATDTGAKECYNVLANVVQNKDETTLSIDNPFFSEKNGTNSLQYSLKVQAFPILMTRCSTTKYLWTKASYNYSASNDCGVRSIPVTSGVLGKDSTLTSDVPSYFSSPVNSQWLTKGKYIASKQLTFSKTDINSQIRSFVSGNEPNCFYDIKHFVRGSVDSTKFPCVDADTLDPCAKKRKIMMAELWPDAKYGFYKRNDGPAGPGTGIGIHVDTTPVCPELYFCCNGTSAVGIATIPYPGRESIFTTYATAADNYTCSDGLGFNYPYRHLHFRFSDSCIHFPDTVWKNGRAYTNVRSLPIDTFIYIFNDSMAAAMLPIHPEYCKLVTCGFDYEEELQNLQTFKQAELSNRFYLDSMINHDPLYYNAPTGNKPAMKIKLSTFKNYAKRIDTFALEEAYCSAGTATEALHCVKYLHKDDIRTFTFTDATVKQLFFEQQRNYYLANRSLVMQLSADAVAGSCGPCSLARIPNVLPNPVFPTVFSTDGTHFDTSMHAPGWMDSVLHSVMTYDTANLHTAPHNVQDSITAIKSLMCSSQVTYIMGKLANCTASAPVLALVRANLEAICTSGGVDSLTVKNVKNAITSGTGLSLGDLCNPFLMALNNNDFSLDKDFPFNCGTPLMYAGLKDLLNRSQMTGLMKTATLTGSTATTFALSGPTNPYEAKIASYLAVSGTATINARGFLDTVKFVDPSTPANVRIYKFIKIKLYASGPDTFRLYMKRKLDASPYLDTVTGAIVTDTAFCLNDDADLLYTGYNAENTAVVDLRVNGVATSRRYTVWSNGVTLMSPASGGQLVDCINCLDIKKALDDFKADKAVYSYDDAYNHPLFHSVLANYLNFKLHKNHTYNEYVNLMKGCAVTDKTMLKKHFATVKLVCTTDTTTVLNGIKLFTQRNIIDTRFMITSSGQTQIGIDLNGVPDDSILYYVTKTKALVAPGNSFYLFDAPTRVFSDTFCTPASPLSAFMSPYTTTAIKYYINGQQIGYNMYEYSGTYSTAKDQSDKIVGANTFAAQCANTLVYPDATVLRSDDYSTSDKQAYLTYVYGLSNPSRYDISDSIGTQNLKVRIAAFAGNTLDYQDPNCSNNKRDLYIYNASQTAGSGYTVFNTILTSVKSTFSNHLFPAAGVLVTNGGTGLKIYQKANTAAWYRYFDANDNMYNIYLTPPESSPYAASALIYDSLHIGPGLNDVYKFSIFTHDPSAQSVELKGYTDFPIGTGRRVADVVLYNKPGNYSCVDSADCELFVLNDAVMAGKTKYQQYFDSTTNALTDSMLYFVVNNTADTLNLCTQAMRNQVTLYYHDLAGNLVKTVPPAGYNRTMAGANTKVSTYVYSSLNELMLQKTPDGGNTNYWYDISGKVVYSLNSKQRGDKLYSYTLYDPQERIIETGQVKMPSGIFPPDQARMVNIVHDLRTLTRTEVVKTFYDEPVVDLPTKIGYQLSAQENLQGRVSAICYYAVAAPEMPTPSLPQFGTHYSYDMMGNVKTITYACQALQGVKQEYKRIDYDYDQVSGKVNMLSYNRGSADQIFHKYYYDADNRIKEVRTSKDGMIWNSDARYAYYKHGPLASVKLGDDQLQSVEYAYTIQGWLKAINSDVLRPDRDMGKNGPSGDRSYARDVMAMSLNYFNNDYKPIGNTQVTGLPEPAKNLYNGNIAAQTLSENTFGNQRSTYRYDQVQRLKLATYAAVNESALTIASPSNIYKNKYDYDADGNITTLVRYDNAGTKMDSILYNYAFSSNRLQKIDEKVTAATTPVYDIEKPAYDAGNGYFYDSTGNLIKDLYNNQRIEWNLYGKVKTITDTVKGERVVYEYDGLGNRVRKEVTGTIDSISQFHSGEYYVNDAQGNVIATYNFNGKYSAYDLITAANNGLYTDGAFAPFIVTMMAGYGDFYNQFMTRALTNDAAWCSGFVPATDLGFYANNDNTIYQNVVKSNGYLNDLQNADNIPIHMTPPPSPMGKIIADAFADAGGSMSGVLNIILNFSTERTLLFQYFDQYFMPFSSPVWTTLTPSPPTYTPGSFAANAASLDAWITANGKSSIVSKMITAMTPDFSGPGMNTKSLFYEAFCGSNTIWRSANLRSATPTKTPFETILTTLLYNFADRNMLCNFYNTWTGGNAWMATNTTVTQRLGIKVADNPQYAISDFLGNTSDYVSFNRALAATYKLIALNYAHAVVDHPTLGGLTSLTSFDVGLGQDTLSLAQHHIYGSSKLGMQNYPAGYTYKSTYSIDPMAVPDTGIRKKAPWYSYSYGDLIKPGFTTPWGNGYTDTTTDSTRVLRLLGYKWYNMTDHLGNIVAVLKDRKSGFRIGAATTYDRWHANIADLADYYPFGMKMPGRLLLDSNDYGYNGQKSERDMYKSVNANLGKYDVHSTAKFWEYDNRIARRWNLDPVVKVWESPYLCFNGNPILVNDVKGDDAVSAAAIALVTQEAAGAAAATGFGAVAVPFIEAIGLGWSLYELVKDEPVDIKNIKSQTLPIAPTKTNAEEIKSRSEGARAGERSGKVFTPKGKAQVWKENEQANGGQAECENCGIELKKPSRSQSGVPRERNEGQVDHIYPKSKGGDGTPKNGQLLCPGCNGKKGDFLPNPKVAPELD